MTLCKRKLGSSLLSADRRPVIRKRTEGKNVSDFFHLFCTKNTVALVSLLLLYFGLSHTQSLHYTLSWRRVATNKHSSCYCGQNQSSADALKLCQDQISGGIAATGGHLRHQH